MIKNILFFVLFLGSLEAWSYAPSISAYRKPGASYQEYTPRSLHHLKKSEESAYEAAVLWSQLDLSKMEDWQEPVLIQEAFTQVRDTRFLKSKQMPTFLRRSSWLYPMDGCFARAGLAARNLTDWKYPQVHKIFVFGNLAVKTKNSPDGEVTWWFHVVAAAKIGKDIIVFDPSIEATRALTLKEWLETMTDDISTVKVSLCDSKTYDPYDKCSGEDPSFSDWGANDQLFYLDLEWDNLLQLKREPKDELGEAPPWLKH